MIRDIVTDQFILSQKSVEATLDDMAIVQDLRDTLVAHEDHCVGMAANMIGYHKRIIIVKNNNDHLVMINPIILKTSGRYYDTHEGCLSHIGEKAVKRYEKIKVEYKDIHFKVKIKTFEGYVAQIIQHEIDLCQGILI